MCPAQVSPTMPSYDAPDFRIIETPRFEICIEQNEQILSVLILSLFTKHR